MRGQPGHNTRPHDLTTERSFDSQATGSLMCLGSFVTFYILVFVQPVADRRSVESCRNKVSVLYMLYFTHFSRSVIC